MFHRKWNPFSPKRGVRDQPPSAPRGMNVKVGPRGHEQTIHIPGQALQSCPFLRQHVVEGSAITNIDPIIFKILIQYLDNGFGLSDLAEQPRIMLSFAKAWHLAKAIELPVLQNRLTDFFRGAYLNHLHTRSDIQPDPEAFAYLRDFVGYYSEAEKFMIDFHAGLCHLKDESDLYFELVSLPQDIIESIVYRRRRIIASGGVEDRIMDRPYHFHVSESAVTDNPWALRIVPPPESSSFVLSPSKAQLVRVAHQPGQRPSAQRSTSWSSSLRKKILVCLPGLSSVSGEAEVVVEPQRLPEVIVNLQRATAPQRIAPFMPPSSGLQRQLDRRAAAEDSADSSLESYGFSAESLEERVRQAQRELDAIELGTVRPSSRVTLL
ncbi:hypothetical protein BCR34DRAFT_610357 [Clohesyomyces aquaticus]|uniref:BTB domain-containing protein n=1 Tax=Clohesyomyces aquaticus TaxID=1231657 RepID=A0A1Y2A777_9PLEO|nr:hypothetical protein BCR34DRAFT_610357 [Clohesyomyces aquaticus]